MAIPDLAVPVIQFEKDGAEDAGLVKIDLLGNRSLAVIRDAIAAVKVHTGREIDYTRADPEDDEPTRALFRTGQTMGVFYTESPASRMLCAKSRADTFELLVLNTSIIRPASNRFIRHLSRTAARRPLAAARSLPARHARRDLRGHGLPGGRGQRLRRFCRDAAVDRRRSPQGALQEAAGQAAGRLRRGILRVAQRAGREDRRSRRNGSGRW